MSPTGQHCGVLMSHESIISAPHYHGPYEFVLLSRNKRIEPAGHMRQPQTDTMHPPGTPIWDRGRFVWDEEIVDFDEKVFETGEWKVLNVMLIRWDETRGQAERVAVGRMHEDTWNELGPQNKDVVMR